MGIRVCRLMKVQSSGFSHYMFVAGRGTSKQEDWIERNFSRLAKEIGGDAAIVKGLDNNLTEDIYDIIRANALSSVEGVLSNTLCYVVTHGDVRTTTEPIIFIPVARPELDESASLQFLESVTDGIVNAISNGRIDDFVKKIGCIEIPLKSPKRGIVFTTLRYINDVLMLQPSICGIGININSAIRPLIENPRLRI